MLLWQIYVEIHYFKELLELNFYYEAIIKKTFSGIYMYNRHIYKYVSKNY